MQANENGPATPSEAYLTELCRGTFLRLWSFPNLYRDQKRAGSGSHGKELCDLLVVFGDDVIIFSDKHCVFATDKPPELAWSRWYRSAVLESARQVTGAERWIREHPRLVFADRSCSKPFPLDLPNAPRFHRVVTCRGCSDAVREHLGGDGSLMVTNKALTDCETQPFTTGAAAANGSFVHVFDDVALEAVLRTVDTVADFCEYLTKRASFFSRPIAIHAAGEPDLLGFYLWSLDGHGRHDFIVEQTHHENQLFVLDEGFWSQWERSEQRRSKLQADAPSYAWDKLIEEFCHHMVNGTQHFSTGGPLAVQETGVRWMAREGRVRRRMLGKTLLQAMQLVETTPGITRRRMVLPTRAGDPHWVLLAFHRSPDMPLERYRTARRQLLVALFYVVKFLHPEALDIAGVAVSANTDEMSEDFVYLDAREWTNELNEAARRLHEEGGLFRDTQKSEETVWEYPVDGRRPAGA